MVCTTQPALLSSPVVVPQPKFSSVAFALLRALAAARTKPEAVDLLQRHARAFPGIIAVEFEAEPPPFPALPTKLSVVVAVRASKRTWGSLRARCSSGGPRNILIAEFLANQLALALNRIQTETEYRELKRIFTALDSELHTRKLLHRARGVVARWYGVPEEAAEVRIRTLGESSGRTLADISRAVIEAEELPVTEAVVRVSGDR